MSNWEEWKNYRNEVTDFIIGHCEKGSSVAILGAGKCEDIELERLKGHFAKIVLMDRDAREMEEALEKLKKHSGETDSLEAVKAGGNIEAVQKEFVGITGDDFAITMKYCTGNLMTDLMQARVNEFSDGLIEEIERIYANISEYNPELGKKCFDYAVVLGTHSQLNNNFTAQWFLVTTYYKTMINAGMFPGDSESNMRALAKIEADVAEVQRRNTDAIIARFNDAVTSMASKGLILGIEEGNTGNTGSQIDGAYNALRDIENRIEKHELSLTDGLHTVWPFSKERGISYDMKLMSLKPD